MRQRPNKILIFLHTILSFELLLFFQNSNYELNTHLYIFDTKNHYLSHRCENEFLSFLTVYNIFSFQMVNAVTDIQEDTLVEIVLNAAQLEDDQIEIRPHSLVVHSYKAPTFCHFCGEMLFGMFKQVSICIFDSGTTFA